MTVYVFGNPDLPEDSLPLKILPKLRERFSKMTFTVKDPNEEWDVPEKLTVIDTVKGITVVQKFTDLSTFEKTPRFTVHDFDALTQLRLLKKLGKVKEVMIIGVPEGMDEGKAIEEITAALRSS